MTQKCNCCIHEEVCIKSEAYKYACRHIMHNVPNDIANMISGNIKCKHFQPKSTTIRKCGDAE